MKWLSWFRRRSVTVLTSHASYLDRTRDPGVFRLMIENRFDRHCSIGKIVLKGK